MLPTNPHSPGPSSAVQASPVANVNRPQALPHVTAPLTWQTRRFKLVLDRPLVMGIVNATPDSFSDGGQSFDPDAAVRHCERLVRQGVHLLDIGGESTRPMATPVPAAEELRRVLPVVRAAVTLGVPVSVDTSQSAVMQAVLDAGADVINDVRALRDPAALAVCAQHPNVGVCLMHMPGEPSTMQSLAHYADVVSDVANFLAAQAQRAQQVGIAANRIVLDPGFGFGKRLAHNLALMQSLAQLLALGHPLLVGLSRKRMLGELTAGLRSATQASGEASTVAHDGESDRLVASAVAALAAAQRGAHILRVHDVAATLDALAVWQALGWQQR